MKKLLAVALAVLMAASGSVFAKGFSGGGRSFSTPSRSFSSPSPSRSFSSPSPSRSFSSPSPSPSRSFFSSTPSPSRPSAPAFQSPPKPVYDGAAARAAQRAESRDVFREKTAPPKPAATDTGSRPGISWSENRSQPSPSALSGQKYTYQNWSSRERRAAERFGTAPSATNQPTVVYAQPYNDGINNMWFYMWLMDHNRSQDRVEWAYHHRDEIDPARLEALKKQDADFDRRLQELEQSGTKKNPAFVPKDLGQENADLMYKDEVVAAKVKEESHAWTYFWSALTILLLVSATYYVFFRRFEVPVRRRVR